MKTGCVVAGGTERGYMKTGCVVAGGTERGYMKTGCVVAGGTERGYMKTGFCSCCRYLSFVLTVICQAHLDLFKEDGLAQ